MSPRACTVALLTVLSMATACTGGDVEAAESDLARRFLEPLSAAGLGVAVEDTCHLRRDSDAEPWHLEVRVRVDTPPGEAADVLEARDVVLVRDRDPIVVQQERGAPAGGWNGVLEARGEGSTLGLTYNDVGPDGPGAATGWAEACRPAGSP